MRFADKQFDVEYDSAKTQVATMLALIKKRGYTPSVKKDAPLDK